MQYKRLFTLVWLFFSVVVFGHSTWSQSVKTENKPADRQLSKLLREKDFFRLEKQFATLKQQLSPEKKLYFRAYLDNAFNRNKEAVHHIDSLLNNSASGLEDSVKAELHLLRGESSFKLFQYANAAESDSLVLNRYRNTLDSNRAADIANKLIIYNGLKNILPQQTSIPRTTTLRWKRNRLGIVEIPIERLHTSYDAVFDTRANISAITQTYATKLRLQTLPVSYYEGSGITGIRFKTSLAVADSLLLGDILIRNAVFQVVPDSVLYIAPVRFQINIIVGFPIIEQLREIHFYKDGKMEVPVHASKSNLHNLSLDGLNPVVSLRTSNGDTLCFAFDFGASKSMLFAAYFQKYRKAVLAKGTKTTSEYGGAGGTQKKEVLTLPSVDLFLAGKKARLDSIDVLSDKVYPEETFYGNIGQDFVNRFQELVLNFQDMYMKGL